MNELMPQTNSLTYVDPAAVAAAESVKARIQSAYIMAYQKPRSYDESRIDILSACKRPLFAEKVEYKKPMGKKQNPQTGKWEQTYIAGPSIRFAELALRAWRNVMTETQVVYEDDKIRRVRVSVLDLETNATFSKDIQVGKTVERKSSKDREVVGERTNSYGEVVYVVVATDDELMNKEAALVSKAIRNEGLRLIPEDIIEEALETARATLCNRDAQDPDGAKKRLVDSFAVLGVRPRDLEIYFGHPLTVMQPAELHDLRAIYQAIKDGQAKWSDYMATGDEPTTRQPNPSNTGSDLKSKLAEKAGQSDPPEEKPKATRKAKDKPAVQEAQDDVPNPWVASPALVAAIETWNPDLPSDSVVKAIRAYFAGGGEEFAHEIDPIIEDYTNRGALPKLFNLALGVAE